MCHSSPNKMIENQRCSRATEKPVGKNATTHAHANSNHAHQSRPEKLACSGKLTKTSLHGPMIWKVMQRIVWGDIASWRKNDSTTLQSIVIEANALKCISFCVLQVCLMVSKWRPLKSSCLTLTSLFLQRVTSYSSLWTR